mmetsp:Transcript_28280/g.42834  ORF Transcript_28280/g.42834 Transcript_28280/m.42834 type:complete len:165 (+) Transcript_28280:139-633(+)
MALEKGDVDLEDTTDESSAFDSRVQELLASGDPAAESYKLLENRYLKATHSGNSMKSYTTILVLCLVILTLAFIIVYFILEKKRNALHNMEEATTLMPTEMTPVKNIISQEAFERAYKKGQIAVGQVVRAEDSSDEDSYEFEDEENQARSKPGTENDLIPYKGR